MAFYFGIFNYVHVYVYKISNSNRAKNWQKKMKQYYFMFSKLYV